MRNLTKTVLATVLVTGSALTVMPICGQAANATVQQGFQPAVKVKARAKIKAKVKPSKHEVLDIVLQPRNSRGLSKYAYATVNPKSASYRHYLTPKSFAGKYGQSQTTVNQLTKYLKKYHLKTKVYAGNLVIHADGTVKNINKAFKTKLVNVKTKHKTYQVTKQTPKLPAKLTKKIIAVMGLTSYGNFKSRVVNRSADNQNVSIDQSTGPQKFSNRYGVKSLYQQGLRGQGQRIAILTFANFHPADAEYFWKQEGLTTKANRIKRINVNGGSNWSGYNESTLDVEQAGAIAPDANLDVYLAPQNDTGMIDALATILAKNNAAQITTSWGQSEGSLLTAIQQNAETKHFARVFNLLYEQAAVQGISSFASTGDSGAYDSMADNPDSYINQLTVDFPANSAYVTATGGTTLPFSSSYTTQKKGKSVKVPIKVDQERAWGSDYLYKKFDGTFYNSAQTWMTDYFAGGGGGFSRMNTTTPAFQRALTGQGINTFHANKLWETTQGLMVRTAKTKYVRGTGHGRNVPDLAFNADPNTGYDLYITSKKQAGKQPVWSVSGGTSIVAPQVAGAAAVMNSGRSTRLGYLNPQMYRLAKGSDSPFTPLTAEKNNSNLYYTGQAGKLYNQATGLGTANFEKLYRQLK